MTAQTNPLTRPQQFIRLLIRKILQKRQRKDWEKSKICPTLRHHRYNYVWQMWSSSLLKIVVILKHFIAILVHLPAQTSLNLSYLAPMTSLNWSETSEVWAKKSKAQSKWLENCRNKVNWGTFILGSLPVMDLQSRASSMRSQSYFLKRP